MVLEYRVRDQFEPATFAVQLEQLAACEAKSPEPVSFEPSAEGVTVQWLDHGIPQQAFCPKPTKELPAFPDKPQHVWTTDAGLLRGSPMPLTRPIPRAAVSGTASAAVLANVGIERDSKESPASSEAASAVAACAAAERGHSRQRPRLAPRMHYRPSLPNRVDDEPRPLRLPTARETIFDREMNGTHSLEAPS